MQTDPTGNLLSSTKITSTMHRRKLAYLVEINATPGSPGTVKDTTGWTDGDWLNVTEDVESISGSMSIVPPYTSIMQIGSVPPAACQIVLRNGAKYSPNRTDGTLYTQLRMDSGAGGIYQLPVRVWIGFYDDPSLSPAASTTLSAGMTATTYNQSGAISLTASKNAGCILQVDNEQMVVRNSALGIVHRGFAGTTPASHSNGATVSVLGAVTPQFTGVVHAFQENSKSRTITLTCFDRSYLLAQAKITSPTGATLITQDATADTIIAQYADALPASPGYLPVPSAQRTLDNGLYPVNFAWADDSSAWGEIGALASADGGVAFFKKTGTLLYFNSQHYIGAASVYTFDTLNMGDLAISTDYNATFSVTTASYSAQVVAPSQLIYSQSETMIVPAGTVGSAATTLNMGGTLSSSATSITLTAAGGLANGNYIVIGQEQILITAGGGTTSITVTRGQLGTTATTHADGSSVYKVTAGATDTITIQFYSPTTSVTTPTAITTSTMAGDWQAVTGGGTNITAGCALSMTNYAQRSEISFTNSSAFYAAYITKFQLFGTPVHGYPARKISKTKTTVPSGLAKRTIRLAPNFYWQDEAQTTGVVDMLADRWKTGRNIIVLKDAPGVPQLELGDLITVTEATALTASVTGYVMRLQWDLGSGREPLYRQTLEIADSASFYQNANYFVVGTDALGSTKKYYY